MLRIHVAQWSPEATTSEFVTELDLAGVHDVLMLGVQRHAHLADLDRLVVKLPDGVRLPSGVVVVRAHPGDASRLLPDTRGRVAAFVDLLGDRSDATVLLLRWDAEARSHRLVPLRGQALGLAPEQEQALVADLRRAELQHWATQPGAFLPANDSFHYQGPNGNHYRTFLRAGVALQNSEALDASAFWLLPHVEPDTTVIVDTNAIRVVGLHLGQYLREETVGGASVRTVQSLRGYDDGAEGELQRRLGAVVAEGHRGHALVLTSVVSSGLLSLRGRAVAAELDYLGDASVAIYGPDTTQEQPREGRVDQVLCPLTVDFGAAPQGGCPLCDPRSAKHSPAIRISVDTDLLNVAQTRLAAAISEPVARPAKQVMDRYAGLGVFSAHRDEAVDARPGVRRHHAVFVDALPLLSDAGFLARLEEACARLPRPDLILAPNHEAGAAMADLVSVNLGCDVLLADPEELPRLGHADATRLASADEVLIVDDVVVTGARLRAFRQALLEAGVNDVSLRMLVAFCRPTTATALNGIVNYLHQRTPAGDRFHAVESLLLPNWDASECPWCWERDSLGRHGAEADEVSEALIRRHSTLNTAGGLVDDLFWGWEHDRFPVGGGSVLGPDHMTQADVFASVAAAVQAMRSDGSLDETYMPPVSKLLVPEFWETGRFYAPAITAAILRASRPHDLRAPVPNQEFNASTSRRLREHGSRNLRAEMLLAVTVGKLPYTDAAIEVLTDGETDDGVTAFFAGLLGTREHDPAR